MCGIDTAYSNQGMKIILEARQQARVVLTRNTHLRDKEGVFFLESSDSHEQFQRVVEHFDLCKNMHLFSRCIECNSELKPVSKRAVQGKVPYFTYKNFDEFAQCQNCARVYWKGSHYRNMLREIEDVFKKENCT
jgi:uncharacterized protein with PIN domain